MRSFRKYGNRKVHRLSLRYINAKIWGDEEKTATSVEWPRKKEEVQENEVPWGPGGLCTSSPDVPEQQQGDISSVSFIWSQDSHANKTSSEQTY